MAEKEVRVGRQLLGATGDPGPMVALQRQEDPMMDIVNPTPAEREMLVKSGWRPGQRIPKTLARDTETTTSDKAQQVRAVLAAASIEESRRQAEAADLPDDPAPGVVGALQQIESGTVPKLDVENDMPADAETPQPENAAAQPQFCPYCGWDQHEQEVIKVSAEDKLQYRLTLLGEKPFTKTYQMLGGDLEVTLRGLAIRETDACRHQCWLEVQREELPETGIPAKMLRYLTCLQVSRIRMKDGASYRIPDTLEGWGYNEERDEQKRLVNTPLRAIADQMFREVITSTQLYGLLSTLVVQFNALLSRLEYNAANEGFWKATGSSA